VGGKEVTLKGKEKPDRVKRTLSGESGENIYGVKGQGGDLNKVVTTTIEGIRPSHQKFQKQTNHPIKKSLLGGGDVFPRRKTLYRKSQHRSEKYYLAKNGGRKEPMEK